MLHELGNGRVECSALHTFETGLHEPPSRLVGGLTRDLQGRIAVVESQLVQHRAPGDEVRALIEPEKVHDARELSCVQVCIAAGAQARILRIAIERQLAVTLRFFKQASKPIYVGNCKVGLDTGPEVFEQKTSLVIGAFEISGLNAMGHDTAGGGDQVGVEFQCPRCAASDFCRAAPASAPAPYQVP